MCIFATRAGNTVYFYHEGGVDIGDVDNKAEKVDVNITSTLSEEQVNILVSKVPEDKKRLSIQIKLLHFLAITSRYAVF